MIDIRYAAFAFDKPLLPRSGGILNKKGLSRDGLITRKTERVYLANEV